MSVKNYRFVSPGVFVNEIDNSQLPASPAGIGPVIFGRARKGPALRPTTVNSFEEFVNIFGSPSPGNDVDDVWREGNNVTAPTYGAYTAQAYLRNSSPLTYVRLLGADKAGVAAAGQAGWSSTKAWGLVVFETGSAKMCELTGALAAVFYTAATGTLVQLSGAIATVTGSYVAGSQAVVAAGGTVTGSQVVVQNTGGKFEYKMLIKEYDGTDTLTSAFNFSKNDSKYIRKVFNTNPQQTNSGITDNTVNYFLGETFDRHLAAQINSSQTTTFATIVELSTTASAYIGNNFKTNLLSAVTPKVISCRLSPSAAPHDLFHFSALNEAGDWTNKNLKISIQDIAVSTNDSSEYGTFSVVVRHLSDTDNVVRIIEQFNNCDLNPDSLNYVARLVGDKYTAWNTDERRYQQSGDYDNRSDYIRIIMNTDVAAGITDAQLLPFGFRGIVKYDDENNLVSGAISSNWVTGSGGGYNEISGSATDLGLATSGSLLVVSGGAGVALNYSADIIYPAPEFRINASDGNLNNPTDAYFGLQTAESAGSTVFDRSNIDLLRPRGGIVGSFGASTGDAKTELSMLFTLDDISGSAGTWVSGSRDDSGTGSGSLTYGSPVVGVLDAGFDRFTVPLYGGFDGLDVFEMDPFANRTMASDANEDDSYEFHSIRRAIDSVADPEVTEMNLASIPALTQETLTTHLIRTCEARGDALAVIDLPNGYSPREETKTPSRNNTAGEIRQAIANLRSRSLNTSYGCTYYPWLRCRDNINGALVWLPPSVAAIGTFSSSQRRTQLWFAPAGFNRGGLTEGSAGIPVLDVAHQLRRVDRDNLYNASINPIAKFPAEGIVIFGQKTLQTTASALDRINVRRLMIFVKKRVSQMASTILFDPNAKTTWARFTSQVNPFLANIKTNFGLSDYKVILDETTTTPELVDRNILYAQIFLKPTRAIEYIAIDFNITRTGASFDD
tara:strand:- start:4152 stop:7013 length:2862 start_codon:yes stop_codon:yes gene_type:complete